MTQRCRVCGCSNLAACDGGCSWVSDDLCSSCAPVDDPVANVAYLPDGTAIGRVVGWAAPGVPIVEYDVEWQA